MSNQNSLKKEKLKSCSEFKKNCYKPTAPFTEEQCDYLMDHLVSIGSDVLLFTNKVARDKESKKWGKKICKHIDRVMKEVRDLCET